MIMSNALFSCVVSCAVVSVLGVAQDDCDEGSCPDDTTVMLALRMQKTQKPAQNTSDAHGRPLESFGGELHEMENLSGAPAIEAALFARNTSDHISFLEATETYEAGEWVDLESKNDCQVLNKAYQWFGKAPFCQGSEQSCTDNGMKFVRYGLHGNGCWSGKKVLCMREKYVKSDDCNVLCNPGNFSYHMYGTAPFCEGGDCDCWRQGQIPIGRYGQYTCPCHDRRRCPNRLETEGNALCWTGQKQFCVTPTWTASFNLESLKSCDFRNADAEKTKRAAMDMVGKVTESGATVAVAAYGGR